VRCSPGEELARRLADALGLDLEDGDVVDAAVAASARALETLAVELREASCQAIDLVVELLQLVEDRVVHCSDEAGSSRLLLRFP
jgi:hypothetical protein